VRSQAVARIEERRQQPRSAIDNWLGFVGDVEHFTGEVRFKSMLRIDGNFSGKVTSADGTLIVSAGAHLTEVHIDVAVIKVNGSIEGEIKATRELILGPAASVTGQVRSPALVMAEGAQFNGSFHRT